MPAQHAAAEGLSGLRRWRPAPFVLASLMLHVAGLVALMLRHELWPWILSIVAGNQVVLLAAVLWPRGRLLGPNLVRLPQSAIRRRLMALTFDDGPDPVVTPQVLDVLDQYQVKASFFCVGEKAAAHPEIVRDIVRRGHSVENHTHRHPRAFAFYGFSRLRREVESAQTVIAGITGRAPGFFRAPAGFRSPFLDAVLTQRGIHHVSWTRRGFDAVSRNPVRVLRRLVRGLAAGDVLLLHDGSHARTAAGDPLVLAVLPALLDQLAARGLRSVSLPTAFNLDLASQPTAGTASLRHSERQHGHA